MRTQFIRLEAFSFKQVERILAEADRNPGFCSHVEKPQVPSWKIGCSQTIRNAIDEYMGQPVKVRHCDGGTRLRKQRTDHRCLVAGVISWPDSIQWFRDTRSRERAIEMHRYIGCSLTWLQSHFGEALAGAVTHTDEGYPHLHFFCVGEANKLHPGLRAEFVDGRRLKSHKEKQIRYKAAMREFLDDFHGAVGSRFGLERRGPNIPLPRIKSRPLALRVLKLERRLRELADEEGLTELAGIVEKADQVRRPSIRF